MLLAPTAPNKRTIVRKNVGFGLARAAFSVGSWIAPAATIDRAIGLFCTPSVDARQRARTADARGATASRLDASDRGIEVYCWGDAAVQPYVLLAHGWSDFGLRFVPLAEALRAAGYAVVAFDQPGHGRSDGDTATLPEFASAVGTVGAHFGPAAAVIGHSMGGAAAAIALRDGLAADRAILVAPPADLAAAADRFAGLVGLAPHLHERLRKTLETRVSVRFEDVEAHRHVPAIDRPALIIHDLDDREVPWSEGERYARYWPDSRLLTTTGLGHNRILGDTAVIGAMLDFLRGEPVGERVVSTGALPFGIA